MEFRLGNKLATRFLMNRQSCIYMLAAILKATYETLKSRRQRYELTFRCFFLFQLAGIESPGHVFGARLRKPLENVNTKPEVMWFGGATVRWVEWILTPGAWSQSFFLSFSIWCVGFRANAFRQMDSDIRNSYGDWWMMMMDVSTVHFYYCHSSSVPSFGQQVLYYIIWYGYDIAIRGSCWPVLVVKMSYHNILRGITGSPPYNKLNKSEPSANFQRNRKFHAFRVYSSSEVRFGRRISEIHGAFAAGAYLEGCFPFCLPHAFPTLVFLPVHALLWMVSDAWWYC